MEYPTLEEAVLVQERIVERTGGRTGVRDLPLLLSALARPRATFGGRDLYGTIEEKAAALVHSLIRNPPFVDGNKRTALTLLYAFLDRNGAHLRAAAREEVAFTIWIDRKGPGLEEIRQWIAEHLERT